ncbi:MAG: hypothetical protein AABY55_01625, partial [Candidatus Omnitrophota bacterium]
ANGEEALGSRSVKYLEPIKNNVRSVKGFVTIDVGENNFDTFTLKWNALYKKWDFTYKITRQEKRTKWGTINNYDGTPPRVGYPDLRAHGIKLENDQFYGFVGVHSDDEFAHWHTRTHGPWWHQGRASTAEGETNNLGEPKRIFETGEHDRTVIDVEEVGHVERAVLEWVPTGQTYVGSENRPPVSGGEFQGATRIVVDVEEEGYWIGGWVEGQGPPGAATKREYVIDQEEQGHLEWINGEWVWVIDVPEKGHWQDYYWDDYITWIVTRPEEGHVERGELEWEPTGQTYSHKDNRPEVTGDNGRIGDTKIVVDVEESSHGERRGHTPWVNNTVWGVDFPGTVSILVAKGNHADDKGIDPDTYFSGLTQAIEKIKEKMKEYMIQGVTESGQITKILDHWNSAKPAIFSQDLTLLGNPVNLRYKFTIGRDYTRRSEEGGGSIGSFILNIISEH